MISAVLPPEATFRGGEYLTYDLSRRGVDPILSSDDEISLHFKTRKSSGLLFYTGERASEQGGSIPSCSGSGFMAVVIAFTIVKSTILL